MYPARALITITVPKALRRIIEAGSWFFRLQPTTQVARAHLQQPLCYESANDNSLILHGRREQISPDEKLISRLLIDSPALPAGGVMAFLRDVCSSGGDWSTLALSSAYDIIMKRPPARLPALQVVLDAATGADADIRWGCMQNPHVFFGS